MQINFSKNLAITGIKSRGTGGRKRGKISGAILKGEKTILEKINQTMRLGIKLARVSTWQDVLKKNHRWNKAVSRTGKVPERNTKI